MAISLQAGTVSTGLANVTFTPALPADVVAGDLLLLFMDLSQSDVSSGLSGWTSVFSAVGTGAPTNDTFRVYKKTAGSSETAPTITLAASAYQVSMIVRVREADTATGPAQVTAQNSATTTSSIDPPTTGSVKIAATHIDPTSETTTSWSAGPTVLGSGVAGSGPAGSFDAAHLSVVYKLEDTAGAFTFTATSGVTVGTLIFSIAPGAPAAAAFVPKVIGTY